jgi:hypothetical protein
MFFSKAKQFTVGGKQSCLGFPVNSVYGSRTTIFFGGHIQTSHRREGKAFVCALFRYKVIVGAQIAGSHRLK